MQINFSPAKRTKLMHVHVQCTYAQTSKLRVQYELTHSQLYNTRKQTAPIMTQRHKRMNIYMYICVPHNADTVNTHDNFISGM